MKYYLSIDAGTSVIKTVIFDYNFKLVQTHSGGHYGCLEMNFGKSEIDMNLFSWNLTARCIKIKY